MLRLSLSALVGKFIAHNKEVEEKEYYALALLIQKSTTLKSIYLPRFSLATG